MSGSESEIKLEEKKEGGVEEEVETDEAKVRKKQKEEEEAKAKEAKAEEEAKAKEAEAKEAKSEEARRKTPIKKKIIVIPEYVADYPEKADLERETVATDIKKVMGEMEVDKDTTEKPRDKIYGPERPENISDSIKKEKALVLMEKFIDREMGRSNRGGFSASYVDLGRLKPRCGICGSVMHSGLEHNIATKKRKKIERFNPKSTIVVNKKRTFLDKFYSKKY